MQVGQRLRELREAKNLSQGNIEQRTGLLRCYTSRVENGHTVPSIETLEKYARALEIPLYRLFYEGASLRNFRPRKGSKHSLVGTSSLIACSYTTGRGLLSRWPIRAERCQPSVSHRGVPLQALTGVEIGTDRPAHEWSYIPRRFESQRWVRTLVGNSSHRFRLTKCWTKSRSTILSLSLIRDNISRNL